MYYPRDYWILILETSKSYQHAIQRLRNLGFDYNEKHFRWEDPLKNWISDEVLTYQLLTPDKEGVVYKREWED